MHARAIVVIETDDLIELVEHLLAEAVQREGEVDVIGQPRGDDLLGSGTQQHRCVDAQCHVVLVERRMPEDLQRAGTADDIGGVARFDVLDAPGVAGEFGVVSEADEVGVAVGGDRLVEQLVVGAEQIRVDADPHRGFLRVRVGVTLRRRGPLSRPYRFASRRKELRRSRPARGRPASCPQRLRPTR